MAIINTGSFGLALWPGINSWYGQAYNEHPVEYTDIFKTYKSRKAYERDVGTSMFGLAEETGEGSPVSYDSAQQGFLDTYFHVKYTKGFIITKEMVEDDQYDVIGQKRAQALAFSMRQTKEIVGARVLNLAFAAAPTYGDGKALLVSDHPNVAGGTWSNVLSTGSADLSEAALEQACIDIQLYTNDRGLKIALMPEKLIVPPNLDFEANKILRTEYEVGSNNNTVNIVRSRFPGGAKVNHYLTDTDAWFIITNCPDGMKYFERRADDFTEDDDFDTDNAKFKATARYSFGATDKRAISGSPGV